MKACPGCKRHLHTDERSCPFCGAEQRAASWRPGWGAVAFAAAVLGSTACAPGKVTGDDEADAASDETSPDTTGDESGTETSVTATGTDESTDDWDDPSGSFYAGPESDWGTVSECDPFLQDCPDGEKCVPYASTGGTYDANKCVPITGDGQPGDPCMSDGLVDANDDCGEQSVCFGFDEMGVGECTAFCTGTADDPICAQEEACLIANEGSLNLCLDACHPLSSDCPEGEACTWATNVFLCAPEAGDVGPGQACGGGQVCGPSSLCVDDEFIPDCVGGQCCAEYCDLTDPNANAQCEPAGTECVPFYEEGTAPEGYEDLGVCIVPPP